MKKVKKLISGKLQDIEANLEILKKSGKIGVFLYQASLPCTWRYTKEKFIRILEFEKKQEIEKLKFLNKLK